MNRYLFILADRKFAKFLTFYDGILEEQKGLKDLSVPQRVKQNEREALHLDRSDKISRHIEYHLRKHFKLISKELNEFVGRKTINAVFVGGHKELHHLIKKHLSPTLVKKIVSEFITPSKPIKNELMKRCKKEIDKFEKRFFYEKR